MSKMNFDEFKKAVEENLLSVMPEFEGKDVDVSVHDVIKNNDTVLSGVCIRDKSVKHSASPNIYLEGFFDSYLEDESFNSVLEDIADMYRKHMRDIDVDLSMFDSFDTCKHLVLPRIVNAEKNKERLKKIPHRIVEDLAVVYYLTVKKDADGLMSTCIEYPMFESWGISLDLLHDISIYNMQMNETPSCVSLFEQISETMREIGMSDEAIEVEKENAPSMYVLSNITKLNGASVVLDKNFMESVADEIGDDFFVLPSSTHECLAVPYDMNISCHALKEMVREANDTVVSSPEILSYSVYQYSSTNGLRIVA